MGCSVAERRTGGGSSGSEFLEYKEDILLYVTFAVQPDFRKYTKTLRSDVRKENENKLIFFIEFLH